MARSEQVILTNMCMLYDGKGNILVLDRKKKDWPGITFPGGHVKPREAFVEAVKREVLEETGFRIREPELCGVKQFHLKDGTRYVVLLYKTRQFWGKLQASAEGEVYWIPRKDLLNYPLAPDFEVLLKVFEEDDVSEFYYDNEDADWKYRLL